MSVKGLSKRRLKKQLWYAARGMALGLTASLALISGTIVIVRMILGKSIGHRVPVGCAFFTIVVIVMLYRLWHVKAKPDQSRRSVTSVTELSPSDKAKSA